MIQGKSVIPLDLGLLVCKVGFIIILILGLMGDLNEIMHLDILCKL